MARQMRWIDTLVDLDVSSGAQIGLDLTATLEDNERRGLTLTRTLVHLVTAGKEITEVSPGHNVVDLAIAMIDADALTASAFPDPNTGTDEPGRPWVWRDRVFVRHDAASGQIFFPEVRVDLRAQRKMGNSRTVLIAVSTFIVGSTFSVTVHGLIRCGYLLP